MLLITTALTSCITWSVNPQPFPVMTAIPTHLPGILTPTPLIITITGTLQTPTEAVTPTLPLTETPSLTPTSATATNTPITPSPQVNVQIIGCNTSIDITHAMGEVTNAYLTIQNTGNVDLPNMCALLRALDEDRDHPDKKVCLDNLPVGNQTTLKLTVDSAYKQDTLIQVDVSTNETVLLRVDKPSCTDIGLFGGEPADLNVIKPIVP